VPPSRLSARGCISPRQAGALADRDDKPHAAAELRGWVLGIEKVIAAEFELLDCLRFGRFAGAMMSARNSSRMSNAGLGVLRSGVAAGQVAKDASWRSEAENLLGRVHRDIRWKTNRFRV